MASLPTAPDTTPSLNPFIQKEGQRSPSTSSTGQKLESNFASPFEESWLTDVVSSDDDLPLLSTNNTSHGPVPTPAQKQWPEADVVFHQSTSPMEPFRTTLQSHSSVLRTGDGIRKKNARFDIPAERNLNNIDQLINNSTNEQEIKELKQQKRLLRNRQAALDSRQRKKQHTERLEDEKRHYTALINDLEEDLAKAKLALDEAARKEAQYLQYIESTRNLSAMSVGFSSGPSVQYSTLESVFSGDGASTAWPDEFEFDDEDLYEQDQASKNDPKTPLFTRLELIQRFDIRRRLRMLDDEYRNDLHQLLDSHEAQKQSLVGRQELLYRWLRDMKQDETISLFQRLVSTVRDIIPTQSHKIPEGILRLAWTCRCGYKSYDDFKELEEGAVVDLANKLVNAGYITRAQISNQTAGTIFNLREKINNIFVAMRQRITRLKSSSLPLFSKSGSIKSITLQCLHTQTCRWLHLCINKQPYATQLTALHVCKDEEQNEYTDASFFKALRLAYYKGRTWKEKLLFKLKSIEFVEFELCPGNLVDHIVPNKLPSTLDEYDFLPPPPPKQVPPIGPAHMMHLFNCHPAQHFTTSFYLHYIPKRRDTALSFQPGRAEGNVGWGLRFAEKPNSSLAITVIFTVSLMLGLAFAICWSVWKKDMQDAFGVAAYITGVMGLAVTTWQMWAL